jgi:hypothetical protein
VTVTRKSDRIDCSTSNPDWTFHDIVDFFHLCEQTWLDAAGDLIRAVEQVEHTYTSSGIRDATAWQATRLLPRPRESFSSPERGTLGALDKSCRRAPFR